VTANLEILVIEDDDTTRDVLVGAMKEMFPSISVVTAGDGVEALAQIEKRVPSLLILDMMMPLKTGAEVLRELSDRGQNLPVIVMSGFFKTKREVAEKAQIPEDCFEFVRKPFTFKDFVELIAKMLPQNGDISIRRREASGQRTDPHLPAIPQAPPAS
jgi:DNA-binding NtrC family response regulator